MITEDYVSFEIAKLLKEKGFDTPCDRWYSEYTPQYYGHEKHICIEFDEHNRYENNYEFICYAPTLQMAMKWLRKVRNYHIWVEPSHDKEGLYNAYIKVGWWLNKWAGIGYNTHEQACEAAIKYCLESLI